MTFHFSTGMRNHMDENRRDKTESVLPATENKLWLPPLSPEGQEKHEHERRKAIIKETGFSGKTLWDWLQLLIIPLMLASGGFWFSLQQSDISAQASQRQHDSDQKIATENRQNDMQIALDQQRETTLKTYLDDMSDLLLNHHLRTSKPGDEVSLVARERTLTTLRRLDAPRNDIVVQFLQDTHLIGVPNAVVDLSHADLSHDDLAYANLSHANLSWTFLAGANLSHASLSLADLHWTFLAGANLSEAELNSANLSHASLTNANLSHADLRLAILDGTDLTRATVTQEQLAQANSLRGATMPDGSKHP
jgi:uncharacterized protein YjbI with pentapeptide repeats